MKEELTLEEKVLEGIKDVQEALMENIKASKAEMDIKIRKKKAHYTLLKAKERLRSIESELMNYDYDKDDKDYHEAKDNEE